MRKKAVDKERDETVVVKVNGKQARLRDLDAKKRARRLRANFYGPDLEKYLGQDTSEPG